MDQHMLYWTVPGKEKTFNAKPDSVVVAFVYEDAAKARQTTRDFNATFMDELTRQIVKMRNAMTPGSPAMTALPTFEAIDSPPAVPLAAELVRSFSRPTVYWSIWESLAEIELKHRAVPVLFACGAGLVLGALLAGLRGWIRQVRGPQQEFAYARGLLKVIPEFRP